MMKDLEDHDPVKVSFCGSGGDIYEPSRTVSGGRYFITYSKIT